MNELLDSFEADFLSRPIDRLDLTTALRQPDLTGWKRRVANVWRQTMDGQLRHGLDPAEDADPDCYAARWLLLTPPEPGGEWVLYWTVMHVARSFRTRAAAVNWLAGDYGEVPGENVGVAS